MDGEIARLLMLMLPQDIMAMLGLNRTLGLSFSFKGIPFFSHLAVSHRSQKFMGWAPKAHGCSASMSRGTERPSSLRQAPERKLKGAPGSEFGGQSIPKVPRQDAGTGHLLPGSSRDPQPAHHASARQRSSKLCC